MNFLRYKNYFNTSIMKRGEKDQICRSLISAAFLMRKPPHIQAKLLHELYISKNLFPLERAFILSLNHSLFPMISRPKQHATIQAFEDQQELH